MKILNHLGAFVLILICASAATAEIRLAQIFKSNMVLQRDTTVSIWGWGDRGESVKIQIGDDTYKTRVGKDSSWKASIGPYEAGSSYTITITGANQITLTNVAFGEVWLCGGQSNMQYTFRMLGVDAQSLEAPNNDIRVFQAQLDLDYLPKDDLQGGEWKTTSQETLPDFSAVAYYFGKYLYDSLKVPIGLLSVNLGATSIETWMSTESLKPFPQFEEVVSKILKTNKNFKQLYADLAEFREEWDKNHYLTGPGFENNWYEPQTDVSDWKSITVPNFWEYDGLDHDGAVWFRKTFDLPEGFKADSFRINLNQIDDYDITWVNGVKVGESFGNRNWRSYNVSADVLKPKGNVLVVRVFDVGGLGGIYSSAFWGNPIVLGEWKYKQGLKIDTADFPVPDVPNGSIFSYPTLLYNGNIAPLNDFAIKGAIWYQGESNERRAHEYASLLPALIKGWRSDWGYNFPFLVVQLANYKPQSETPGPSNWAEIREAQAKASQMARVRVATAIDIGEAHDIHPPNKQEVGRRLSLHALEMAYDKKVTAKSPAFKSIEINGGKAVITFDNTGAGLYSKDKFGYIRGFQIAGEDKKFYWAQAELRENQVLVSSKHVQNPVSVRYAWSDNPGPLDLYNKEGLPALPFRTDSWPLSTEGVVYSNDPHQF